MKAVKFPQDEKSHKSAVEWWYFNGHLEDNKKNKYSFMNCLFRISIKKIKIPFLKKLPVENLYFSNSVISDIKNKKFYPRMEYLNLVSKDSFSKPLLSVDYTNPLIFDGYFNSVIEKTDENEYKLKTEDVDLKMILTKKPLLLGNGTGYVKAGSKKTYYYSLTNLKTNGTLRLNNKLIKVTGKSWMDHQWANVNYPENVKDKWLWFSIQLDNRTEMAVLEYTNNGKKYGMVSISLPNNKQEHADDVIITPIGEEWISPKTKSSYNTSWRIIVPSKKIDLTVNSLIKHQEMRFGSINYWEGPLDIRGIFKNRKVKGDGFLEIVGHPFKFGNIGFLVKSAINVFQTSYLKSKNIFLNLIR